MLNLSGDVLRSFSAIAVAALLAWAPGPAAADDDRDRHTRPHHHADRKPIVIGHRGASGYRPEHTLAAYRLAIELGADFIEPDLVTTKDGVLIARHEPILAQVRLDASNQIVLDGSGNPEVTSETTNVATKPEFRDRLTVKRLDGVAFGGWFSEDFTLAEIKQLRARERIPGTRPENATFNDQFEIPTLVEVIRLVKRAERELGRKVGIYPETKHPTYFAREGTHLGGKPIRRTLGKMLVETLVAERFTEPRRVFIQSFEVENLIELKKEIMPRARVDLPLVQLYGDIRNDFVQPADSFSRPYDMRYNALQGRDLHRIYGALANAVEGGITPTTGYGDLVSRRALHLIAAMYADGIGPWKDSFLLREPISPPVDGDGDGNAQIATRLTGVVHPFLRHAQRAGLLVHPYTLRAEEPFLTLDADGVPQTVVDEAKQLLALGVDGYFIDQPDKGVEGRDLFLEEKERSMARGPGRRR